MQSPPLYMYKLNKYIILMKIVFILFLFLFTGHSMIIDHIRFLAPAQIDMKTVVVPLKICKEHSEASKNYDALVTFWEETFMPYQKYCTKGHLDFSKTYIAKPVEIPCMGVSPMTGKHFSSLSCTEADISGWTEYAAVHDPKILQYPRRIFLLPQMNCDWAGLGTVGCGTECIILINGPYNYYKHVILHEIGHTLGLQHAVMYGDEYGDKGNVMGSGKGCFGAPQLWEMNWMNALIVKLNLNTMTTLTVPPLMSSTKTIVKMDNYGLFVSYLYSLNELDPVDIDYTNAVMIHEYDGFKSNLLVILHEKETYRHVNSALYFNVTSCTNTYATVEVTKF